MLIAYLKAALLVATLAVVWVAIERAWRRTFANEPAGAGQRDCRGCLVCSRRCHSDEDDQPAGPSGTEENEHAA